MSFADVRAGPPRGRPARRRPRPSLTRLTTLLRLLRMPARAAGEPSPRRPTRGLDLWSLPP